VWREQHPESPQQVLGRGHAPIVHAMPPRDWLLHDPEDLLALANGSAFARLASTPQQASPAHLPHTCWSIQERHLLYPSPAAPGASASAAGLFQQRPGSPALGAGGTCDAPSPALLGALRAYEKMHQVRPSLAPSCAVQQLACCQDVTHYGPQEGQAPCARWGHSAICDARLSRLIGICDASVWRHPCVHCGVPVPLVFPPYAHGTPPFHGHGTPPFHGHGTLSYPWTTLGA